ncbi:MAG: sulfatase-like hydrolase/transferase, partial [Planctomycetota bacterium]
MRHPRNIIMIQSDQHRADWMGCAGARHVHTPALDALAARGVRFDQAYCSYPLCGPSRMSFLTGLHPFRNGIHTNDESLASDRPTFAHALGLGGYRSVLCGRIHFSGPDQRHGFVERIFGDFNPSYPGGLQAEIPPVYRRGSSNGRHAVENAHTSDSYYFLDYDEGVTRAAEEYLATHAAQPDPEPLALCVGYFMPHSPYAAPERFVAQARALAEHMPPVWPGRDDLNHWERGWIEHQKLSDLQPADYREARIQYAAMIAYMDERIGRVLAAAEALPGETLVLYWSDHGEAVGDNGNIAKGCLAETSLHTPLIVAPLRAGDCGLGEGGRVWRQPVSNVDLAPTLCDCAGAPPIPDADGMSLCPVLAGSADEDWWARRPIFAEVSIFPQLPPARMVRRGRYKYVYYHDDRDTLFDIAADPTEQEDLLSRRLGIFDAHPLADEIAAL